MKHYLEDEVSRLRQGQRCPFRHSVTLDALMSYPSPLTPNDTGLLTLTLTCRPFSLFEGDIAVMKYHGINVVSVILLQGEKEGKESYSIFPDKLSFP